MSPSDYEVVAVKEAIIDSGIPLGPEDVTELAMRMVASLHEQDLRLTSGGKTPSIDD